MAKKNKKSVPTQKELTEKKLDSKELTESEKLDLQLRKQGEMEGIFGLTETRNRKPDKKKEALKIHLADGRVIDINVLASEWQSHDPQYTVKFYTPLLRLLNLPGDPSSFTDRRNRKIADFKNQVIWGRFEKEQMDTLRRKNKYGGYYIRRHWYYQGLNDNGILKLQQFIGEATDLMNDCTDYYEFRKRIYKEYGVPYQIQISFK